MIEKMQMRATGTRSVTWPRWAASAAAKALRTSPSRKMACRDCALAINAAAADGPPRPSPASATAARALLADAEPRHGARGSKESTERERDKYGGLRHARSSPAAGAPRAARSSSDGAGGCGARRGWGQHLTGQAIDGVMARRRLAATRMEADWLGGEGAERRCKRCRGKWFGELGFLVSRVVYYSRGEVIVHLPFGPRGVIRLLYVPSVLKKNKERESLSLLKSQQFLTLIKYI